VEIYKILLPSEWTQFKSIGRFDGSPFDRDSGFIHCSSRDQVAGVIERVFAREPVLVVVAIDADALGEAVRWEYASDGGLFPHVYAPLPMSAVVEVQERSERESAGPAGAVGE